MEVKSDSSLLKASLASFLCGGTDWIVLPAVRSHGAFAGRQRLPVDKETRRSSRLCQVRPPHTTGVCKNSNFVHLHSFLVFCNDLSST